MAPSQQLRPLGYLLLLSLNLRVETEEQHLSFPRLTGSPTACHSIHNVQHLWWNTEWLHYHFYNLSAPQGIWAYSRMQGYKDTKNFLKMFFKQWNIILWNVPDSVPYSSQVKRQRALISCPFNCVGLGMSSSFLFFFCQRCRIKPFLREHSCRVWELKSVPITTPIIETCWSFVTTPTFHMV